MSRSMVSERSRLRSVHTLTLVACSLAAVGPVGAQSTCPAWVPGPTAPGVTDTGSTGPARVNACVEHDFDGPGPGHPELVVGGLFAIAGGRIAAGTAAWNGVTWRPLGTGGIINALASIDPDGPGPGAPVLYRADSTRIDRWSGFDWETIGQVSVGPGDGVFALAGWNHDDLVSTPPRLVAGGRFTQLTPTGGPPLSMLRIAAWNGTSWSAIGAGASGEVRAMIEWDEDGAGPARPYLIVGGQVNDYLARWNGTTWSTVGSPILSVLNGSVRALALWPETGPTNNPSLLIGGQFTGAGLTSSTSVISRPPLNSGWTGFGSGLASAGEVRSVAYFDPDGTGPALAKIYAGAANGLYRYDAPAWTRVATGNLFALAGFDIDGPGPGPGALCAGGVFTSIDQPPLGPFGFGANNVYAWTGTSVARLGADGFNDSVRTLRAWDPGAPGGGDEVLVAGGKFTLTPSGDARSIATWDGSTWTPLGSGLAAEVFDVTGFRPSSGAFAGANFLIAGGSFASPSRIAKWDGSAWTPLVNGLTGSNGVSGGSVAAVLALDPDGAGPAPNYLYAGGSFTSAPPTATTNALARWDGNAWSSVGGRAPTTSVLSMTRWDPDGVGPNAPRLVVGMSGGQIGGVAGTSAIAAYDPVANVWLSLAGGLPPIGGLDIAVHAVSGWDPDGLGPTGERLIVSYEITGMPFPRYLAAFDGSVWTPLPTFRSGVISIDAIDLDGDALTPPSLVVCSLDGTIGVWTGTNWSVPGFVGVSGSGFLSAVRFASFDHDRSATTPARVCFGGDFGLLGPSDSQVVSIGFAQLELNAPAPGVSQQPLAATVRRSRTAVLNMAPTGLSPGTLWQRGGLDVSDGPGPSGSRFAGALTPTFVVLNAQPDNSGLFRCVIGMSSCSPAITNEVQLTVVPKSDFTLSGSLEPADIFQYLALYFAGSNEADFSGDGLRTPADIFQMIDAYFAGQ
jgi:hypothetical protein